MSRARRVVTITAIVVGLVGLCATYPYWQHAWAVISDGYQGPDTGMALGIMLVVVGPVILLGFALSWAARPRRHAMALNGLAHFGLLFWLTATSVPSPRPALPPYVAPQPAYVCGDAAPFTGEPGERWHVALAIDFEPARIRGTVAREGGPTIDVLPDRCTYDGTFQCSLPGDAPVLRVDPTLETELGTETGGPIARTNGATASFTTGGTGSYTGLLPYSSSCDAGDVDRAARERADRFDTRLLLRVWYRRLTTR